MNKIKKVTFAEPFASFNTNQETHDSNKPMLHSTGAKYSTSASGSKPSGNTKNNRISQPSSSNKINKVEDQSRSVKTRKNNKNHVKQVKCDDHVMQSMSNANSVSVSINTAHVKNSVNDIKSDCLCYICGCPDCTLGTVRFENEQIARIMGYGDYQLENVIISRRDHLRSACALGKSKKSSHQPKAEDTNQEKLYILHMDLCGPMRVASINGKRYILVIVDDYSRFSWTLREFYEKVGISHQTSVARTPQQNDVFKRTRASCYGSYYTQYMTRFKPCIPPNKDDWDHLFQPMFDEYFNPQTIAVSSVQEVTAPRAEVLADSPVSISITQDALSTSIPSSQEQEHSPIIFQGFEESSKTPTFHDDPLN
nr:ribonuclease H-like domain-containing protein [Tanacetum cinerariifolium]